MSYKIDPPKTLEEDPVAQVMQIQSYLYKLSEQLNYALNTINGSVIGGNGGYVAASTASHAIMSENGQVSGDDASSIFSSLKGLIIKSAEIVEAYKESIVESFNTMIKAISDYGSLTEEERMQYEKSSAGLRALFTNIQAIATDSAESIVQKTIGYINAGEIEDGVYGLEIGQKTEENGVETFNHWARFTPDRLSFFDGGGAEIAYFSNNEMTIPNAKITNSLKMGGYSIEFTSGIIFRWIG